MNKFLLFFLIAILGLSSCANNSDEPDPDPIPPAPSRITEDDLDGEWATYYSSKLTIVNYETLNAYPLPQFRDISYDGFTTKFYKNGSGQYQFISKNAAGDLIDEGNYKIGKGPTKDTILFTWKYDLKDKDGNILQHQRDTVVRQTVNDLDLNAGLLKTVFPYVGINKTDKTKYHISDYRTSRNTKTAPNNITGVSKRLTTLDDLTEGKWEIYAAEIFYNGDLDNRASEEAQSILKGTTYKFYKHDTFGPSVRMSHITNENVWSDYPIVIFDDIISILFDRKFAENTPKAGRDASYNEQIVRIKTAFELIKRSKSSMPRKLLKAETVEEDEIAGFIWVTEWQKRNGLDSFIDLSEQGVKDNASIIERQKYWTRRIQ